MLRHTITLAAAALLAAAVDSAHGQTSYHEPFSAAPGSVFGNNEGFGGEPIVAGSLTYPNLVTSGNRLSLQGDNKGAFTILNQTYGSTPGTIWISFLSSMSEPQGAGQGYGGLSLFTTDGNEPALIGNMSGSLAYGIQQGGLTPENQARQDTDNDGQFDDAFLPVDGATRLLVARIDFTAGNDQITLYVDPQVGPASPTGYVAFAQTSAPNGFTFDTMRLQSGDNVLGGIDEIRIGSSFSDVTPAVPEPAAAALAVGSVLWLGAARRRRHGG